MYRLHSMHGPTVLVYKSLEKGLKELLALGLRNSNGGMYRLLDERSGVEYARINTYAIYQPLNSERNREMFARAATRYPAAEG